MKKCRITVVRKAHYEDLSEKYENSIEHACDLQEGQVFIANGWKKPDGLCESAWESMSPFVKELAEGGGNFYDGWMKNPKSAMISCNDGFRPVSFYIEVIDEAEAKNYKIRKITPDDNETIAKIIRYNLKNHGLDIPGTVYFDESLNDLCRTYSGSERCGYYILADSENNVMGGIGFDEFAPLGNCAELQKLYVADSAKGMGWGYRLISFIEEKMKESGYESSYLETHDNLKVAMHTYEKCGYSKIERPEGVMHGAMNNFYYKKL